MNRKEADRNHQDSRLRIAAVAFSISLTLSFTTPTTAQDEIIDVDGFTIADTDGDGCVNWEEMRNEAVLVFHSLDLNGDGFIEGEEHPEAVTVEGEQIDSRSITPDRFQAALRKSFLAADKDGDGCLNRDEW
jgi:Ca2+-binding EF-hand superfamily protein